MQMPVASHKSLETLRLKDYVKLSFKTDIAQVELESGFPNMRKLQFAMSLDRTFDFRVPWKVIRLSPSIEELDCKVAPGTINTNTDPALQMELRKLSYMRLLKPALYVKGMTKSTFPSLERLDLMHEHLNDDSVRILGDFLEQHGASVKHLDMSFIHLYNQETYPGMSLMDMLQPMHCLIGLTITSASDFDKGLPEALLGALLHAFQIEGGTMHQLEFLRISLDARAVLRDHNVLRNLVVACHSSCRSKPRYFTLHIDLNAGSFGDQNEGPNRAGRLLERDAAIKACESTTFRIVVLANGHDVVQTEEVPP